MDPQNQKYFKIVFSLVPDEDGYPPVASESLWAVNVADDEYRLDNIPFHVTG